MSFTPHQELDFVFPSDDMLDANESDEHRHKKLALALKYHHLGYDVDVEVFEGRYFIDVVARRDGEVVAVEVGNTTEEKYEHLNKYYSEVVHVGYIREGTKVKSVRRKENSKTVRVDESCRDKLNELVEHYNNTCSGEHTQKTVAGRLIKLCHQDIAG